MEQHKYPGLQVDEDIPLQEREWRVQRIAWICLYALLIAIVLGLLGNGPLSHSTAKAADGSISVEYERFMRHRSPETVRLTVNQADGTLRLLIKGEYMKRIEVKKIMPEPEQVIPGTDAMTFVFRTDASRPMQIAFHFQPEQIGMLSGWVEQEGGNRLELHHFVYP